MKALLIASGLTLSAASAASAQTQVPVPDSAAEPVAAEPAGSAEAAQPQAGIQDIVVTAERREARLQDVPITITAATAEQLGARGVRDAFDVGKITPSFNTNRVVGFGSPIMRGIGTTNVTAGDEPSVATYVDGFYQGTSVTTGVPFNNIARIEVLKGPQGTLYGRNATGGLVSIVTRDPSDTFEASGSAGYASYDTVTADGYVSGPLAKGVAFGVSATFRNQGKGFADDIVGGGTVGRNDYLAVKGKLRFEFGANSLVLGGEYIDLKDNRANTNIPAPGSLPLTTGPGVVYATKPFDWAGSIEPRFNTKQWDVNAKLTLDLGFAKLLSLSQYKEVRNYNQVEGDGTTNNGVLAGVQLGLAPGAPAGSPLTPQVVVPYTFAYADHQNQPYFATQELQLVSNAGGLFTWIVGGFFLASSDQYEPLNIYYDTSDLGVPFTSIDAGITTRAYAAFAQGTYAFGNGLSVTGGVRYSTEKKEVSGTTAVPAFGILASDSQNKKFNSFTYRVAVDYRVSPGLLLYATTNKGFKSGTFVGNSPSSPSVRPEILYAYEAGFKADPSRFVRLNASAYYYDYRDIQTFITAPDLTSLLQNAAKAELYGAELSLEVEPVTGLNLTFGLGYEHAKYKSFPNASVYIPSPSGGNYPASIDAGGNQVIRTPDLTANGAITYKFDVGAGSVTLNAAASYTSSFYWDTANLFEQPDYALVDLSAKFATADERWSLSVWGRNVTDHVYAIYRNPQQRYDAVSFGDPATVGGTIGFRF